MKKVDHCSKETPLKLIAAIIVVMMITSSVAIIQVMGPGDSGVATDLNSFFSSYQSHPCEVKTVVSQAGTWVSFDSATAGTPADAHVTVSDTTGITIVADFHGFWKDSFSLGGTVYDNLVMPGADSINDPKNPKLPRLFEYVEIPHDVDISVEVIASSNASIDGYNIRPAGYPDFPAAEGHHSVYNVSQVYTGIPTALGSVYSNDAFFPGTRVGVKGANSLTSIVVRGHRLLGLSFYPVQFNPVSNRLIVFSQLVIKIEYEKPAQIEPIPISLQSEIFEQILEDSLINYDYIHEKHIEPGVPTIYSRIDPISPPMPTATIPMFHQSAIPTGYEVGAEYLIITTLDLKLQANRLAEWKERKGIPSAVELIPDQATIEDVRGLVEFTYNNWYPAPTFVLLFGDVDIIPANYDMKHQGRISLLVPYFQEGYIASDLGYFNIQGNSYFPDMIYSRISVDTVEQAEVIVDKILDYEINPPEASSFYNDILSAGTFEDWSGFLTSDPDGVEDAKFPFLSHLENIRYYLVDEHDYYVHYNYSCAANHHLPEFFRTTLEYGSRSNAVVDYVPNDYDWLWAYDDKQQFREEATGNITLNFNQGRFFVYYYSHGGSKNMIYPQDFTYPRDGQHDEKDRDIAEGWHTPFFDASNFTDLINGKETPLVLSIACNSGWFDGETDQEHIAFDDPDFDGNPFDNVASECFAEELTRLAGGGAIAVIAPSRQAPSRISGDLLDGLIQSFWPGYLDPDDRPIYGMGAALFSSKLYAASIWLDEFLPLDVVQTTYQLYHLFGDPETQLWTDVPSEFSVSFPERIGTTDPQKFVVTVRDNHTQDPIDFAKVCIQQDQYIYQVGYTDSRGQIVFDVDPPDSSSFLNVTVTKHNYKPYISNITVVKSFDAKITVSPEVGIYPETVNITITDFDNEIVTVFFDDVEIAVFQRGEGTALAPVIEGEGGYVNVVAVQAETDAVTLTRFFRLSTDRNPDPYIYSYKDPSTWYLADNERVWDNPCIVIHDGRNPVRRITQFTEYDVNVTVYNRGNGDAVNTRITLLEAPYGGFLTWTPIETVTVSIPLFESREVSFKWTPVLPNIASLNVSIFQEDERPEDMVNNIGQECWNIVPVCSPGQGFFHVGNPSDNTEYVLVNIKQKGDHDDVWSASVQDYSSQALEAGQMEPSSLLIDPDFDLGVGDKRLFTAELYINGELICGMDFQAVCDRNCQWIIILIIAGVVIVALVIWYIRRRKLQVITDVQIPEIPG